jgi:precorrin-3B methylase
MIYEAIVREKLQKALGAMSLADKLTPAAQFIEGVECAHSLGFQVLIYETDTGRLAVNLARKKRPLTASA